MLKAFTYRLSLLAVILLAASGATLLYAYEEEEGYTEQEYSQDEAAFDEQQAPVEDVLGSDAVEEGYAEEDYVEEGYAEKDYVEEVHVEEAQDNYQAPAWEGPIPFEPAYSGNENIKIERSTRPKRKKLLAQAEPDTPEAVELAGEEDEKKQANRFEGECDPMVKVSANQEKRFDILKRLADEHGFEIMMLEAENQAISLEKHEVLSRVIESITRDMSVVLNYQKAGDCERLAAISVLDNAEWSGNGASRRGGISDSRVAEKIRQYKPKFKPISVSRDNEPGTYNSEPVADISSEAYQERQEKMEELEELREERRKAKDLRSLNKELPSGRQLKNDFYVKDDWKKQREEIDNMEVYVEEVMTGERVPNIRGMTIQQRTEYMRLRREYNQQKQQ